METLRDFLKGWMGKGLLILFLLPLAITGFESITHHGDDPNAVAKVGDQSIDGTQLQNSINDRRQSLLEQVKGDTSLINESALHDQTLQYLIDRALITQQAKQLGFTISDAAITQLIASDPNFQDANHQFSNEKFAEFLKQRGWTKEQLFDLIREDKVANEFIRGIVNTGLYSNSSLEAFLAKFVQSREVSVSRIDWHPFAKNVQVSDNEIATYYNQHKTDLKSPETLDLSYLVLDKNALKVAEPTEQEINQQYQTLLNSSANQTEYELAMILMNGNNAQATLAGLKQKLDANQADFATLAKQYSQDEGSKNDGGNIGPISKSMFPKDYDKIMSSVKSLKVGQVTAPIQTQYGYQIFKLVKVNNSTVPSLDSMRDNLRQQVINQKRDAMYQDLVGKINNDAVASVNIPELANRYHLASQTINGYAKTNNKTVINQPAVIAAAFNDVTVQEGSVSVGVDLKDKMVWVQPKNHRLSKDLNQAEAVPVIRAKLTEDKARALALAKAKEIATQVQQHNATSGLSVPFQSLGKVTRQSPGLLEEERSAAFSIPASSDKLAVTTQPTEQGVSILVGSVITQDNSQITPEVKQNMANTIRDNMGQSQLEDYLAYLRTVTPVKIKPTGNPAN